MMLLFTLAFDFSENIQLNNATQDATKTIINGVCQGLFAAAAEVKLLGFTDIKRNKAKLPTIPHITNKASQIL